MSDRQNGCVPGMLKCRGRAAPSVRRFIPILLRALLAIALLVPVIGMAEINTPEIAITATPDAQAIHLEWRNPPKNEISELIVVDTSWGGTAGFEISGDFQGDCDLDIEIRSSAEVGEFTNPEVAEASFDSTNPQAFTYWSGSALPVSRGLPDICKSVTIFVRSEGADSLGEAGTISGNPIQFSWQEAGTGESEFITIPADFRPGIDSVELKAGIFFSLSEGSVNEGERFGIPAISHRLRFAWSYIEHGASESDRVSSSDDGRSELLFCRPGEWADFDFGLSFRFVTFRDTTVVVDTCDPVAVPGIDLDTCQLLIDTLIVEADTTFDSTWVTDRTDIQVIGFVPASNDTLGVLSVLYRKIDGYRIYRSDITNADNFIILKEFKFCNEEDLPVLRQDPIVYMDREGVHNGFPYNYFVTTFDTLTSSESSDQLREERIFPRSVSSEDLERITVVPNPYKRRAAWEENEERIQIQHLPSEALVQIYTAAGDLIREWEHRGGALGGTSNWDMRNEDSELVVSGVYLLYVKSIATGDEQVTKFIVVR